MLERIKTDAEKRMKKTIESFKHDLTKIRTGRANASLLDNITVEYYGSQVPLSQVANVNVSDARTLTVAPWEKSMVKAIEKAIMSSGLGLNPVVNGDIMRVPLPALTEERRRDLIKVVKSEGEGAKVAIRNIRRDVLTDVKAQLKEKTITEDEERRGQDQIQKITDKYIHEVDDLLKVKEAELLEI
ncbi:MAG: ribosome recycling factor [Gammaproteobacteria bacterium]|nr:ribosome recycling factor [Gammaproteobacteria bacterium]